MYDQEDQQTGSLMTRVSNAPSTHSPSFNARHVEIYQESQQKDTPFRELSDFSMSNSMEHGLSTPYSRHHNLIVQANPHNISQNTRTVHHQRSVSDTQAELLNLASNDFQEQVRTSLSSEYTTADKSIYSSDSPIYFHSTFPPFSSSASSIVVIPKLAQNSSSKGYFVDEPSNSASHGSISPAVSPPTHSQLTSASASMSSGYLQQKVGYHRENSHDSHPPALMQFPPSSWIEVPSHPIPRHASAPASMPHSHLSGQLVSTSSASPSVFIPQDIQGFGQRHMGWENVQPSHSQPRLPPSAPRVSLGMMELQLYGSHSTALSPIADGAGDGQLAARSLSAPAPAMMQVLPVIQGNDSPHAVANHQNQVIYAGPPSSRGSISGPSQGINNFHATHNRYTYGPQQARSHKSSGSKHSDRQSFRGSQYYHQQQQHMYYPQSHHQQHQDHFNGHRPQHKARPRKNKPQVRKMTKLQQRLEQSSLNIHADPFVPSNNSSGFDPSTDALENQFAEMCVGENLQNPLKYAGSSDTAQNRERHFVPKDSDDVVDGHDLLQNYLYHKYLKFLDKALSQRRVAGCGNSHLVSSLYQFWVARLQHKFNRNMYQTFKELAVEDKTVAGAREGLECLYRFLRGSLSLTYRERVFRDFINLVGSEAHEDSYGLEQLWLFLRERSDEIKRRSQPTVERRIMSRHDLAAALKELDRFHALSLD